jgi:ApbE superfamily uncharacterized protein (UPF0280 family)
VAFEAAEARFQSVLQELVGELDQLRQPMTLDREPFSGRIARRMARAVRPHSLTFVTPMAAVAGSVADEILSAMRHATPLRRAYVNNGGDIALHLAPGERFTSAMASVDGHDLGRIEVASRDRIGGIATSGRGGRSLSLGIADSVTVLARNAAQADVAATLIANAVDLPDHPAVTRRPASDLQDDSDLGDRLATTHCAPLARSDIHHALQSGLIVAERTCDTGLIRAASLHLQGETRHAGPASLTGQQNKRTLLNA